MAEWLYEEGIGENRAILVEDGEILEAAIEWPDELRAGTIAEGRLVDILVTGRRGMVAVGRESIIVEPLPPTLTKGQKVKVEILRESIPEPDNFKLARGRISDEAERLGPILSERIGRHTALGSVGPDRFEAAGWSELLEDALSGDIGFQGGNLRMSLTPAMTLFDVDGWLPPAELSVAGAGAVGLAVRRMGIGGSIGIDLPTLPAKGDRQRAAEALDAVLPPPFERTAVNGFGFLQVVRRRERQSLAERLQRQPIEAAARKLLRLAERVPGVGARLLIGAPWVISWLEANPALLAELSRRTGTTIRLRADAGRPTWSVHAQSVQS